MGTINPHVRVQFVYNPEDGRNNVLYSEIGNSSLSQLDRLFPVFLDKVTLHFFQDRGDFLEAIGKKIAPEWLVAYVPSRSTSSVYFYISGAPLGNEIEKTRQIFLHEIAHLYTNLLNPNIPDWLKEGISVYIASQIFKPVISKNDWEFISGPGEPFKDISWDVAVEHNGYSIAGLLVAFFVRKYGWDKFINMVSIQHKTNESVKGLSEYFGDKLSDLLDEFKKQFVK